MPVKHMPFNLTSIISAAALTGLAFLPSAKAEAPNDTVRNFEHITSLCKSLKKISADVTEARERNRVALEKSELVYSSIGNVITSSKGPKSRQTAAFFKSYEQEEIEVRSHLLKPLAELVGGRLKSQVLTDIDFLISYARSNENLGLSNSPNCSIKLVIDRIHKNGTSSSDESPTQKENLGFLQLAILPKAHPLSPVFCSERLLQAKLNLEAMSKDEFVRHAQKTLDTLTHDERTLAISQSPKMIGKIVENVARRSYLPDTHPSTIDALHGVSILRFPEVIERFRATVTAYDSRLRDVQVLREEEMRLTRHELGVINEKVKINIAYRKFAEEINPQYRQSDGFDPCAK